ncbi:hypothetical protein M231_07029 [Tremella mesenterica]|uniref:Uncharacterized protein n=1 Tax=Tremella mesenterica TaxID=5217 RepID=A0A4Q1BFW6_TREME|nr:hypothetical protein M231_07029 [Tremella mesenterica]
MRLGEQSPTRSLRFRSTFGLSVLRRGISRIDCRLSEAERRVFDYLPYADADSKAKTAAASLCVPAKGDDEETLSGPSSTSNGILKPDFVLGVRADQNIAAVAMTGEHKTDPTDRPVGLIRSGLAQALIQVLSSFTAFGTYLAYFSINISFVRVLVLDEQVIVMEASSCVRSHFLSSSPEGASGPHDNVQRSESCVDVSVSNIPIISTEQLFSAPNDIVKRIVPHRFCAEEAPYDINREGLYAFFRMFKLGADILLQHDLSCPRIDFDASSRDRVLVRLSGVMGVRPHYTDLAQFWNKRGGIKRYLTAHREARAADQATSVEETLATMMQAANRGPPQGADLGSGPGRGQSSSKPSNPHCGTTGAESLTLEGKGPAEEAPTGADVGESLSDKVTVPELWDGRAMSEESELSALSVRRLLVVSGKDEAVPSLGLPNPHEETVDAVSLTPTLIPSGTPKTLSSLWSTDTEALFQSLYRANVTLVLVDPSTMDELLDVAKPRAVSNTAPVGFPLGHDYQHIGTAGYWTEPLDIGRNAGNVRNAGKSRNAGIQTYTGLSRRPAISWALSGSYQLRTETFVRWCRGVHNYLSDKGAQGHLSGLEPEPFRRLVNPAVPTDHSVVFPPNTIAGEAPPDATNSTTAVALTATQRTTWLDWANKERKARSTLIFTISPGLATQVEDLWSAQEIWARITAQHQVKTTERRNDLNQRISLLRLVENANVDTMHAHLETFKIVKDLWELRPLSTSSFPNFFNAELCSTRSPELRTSRTSSPTKFVPP